MGLPSRLKKQNKQLIVPAYCLREFPGHSTGRRKWGGARPSRGNGVESQGTPRQIEFAGQSTRKERAEQRDLQKPAEGPLSAQQNAPQCKSGRTLRKAGGEPSTRVRGTVPGAYTGLGIVTAPTRQMGKHYNSRDTGYSTLKVVENK